MSRIYVLQSPQLAVSAARMKADANYIGMLDKTTAAWLEENHVFIRDSWEHAKMNERRLQRLYHRLFPGDIFMTELHGEEELVVKALEYASELVAKKILCVRKDETASARVCELADMIISQEGTIQGNPSELIELGADENIDGAAGALAFCCMNELELKQSETFIRKAAALPGLPWYDEIAYYYNNKK